MSRTAFAALLVALLAAPAAAQINLTGDWDMTIQSPQGTNTVKVTLTQDGETVSGRVTSQLGELSVTGALTGSRPVRPGPRRQRPRLRPQPRRSPLGLLAARAEIGI